jgi:5-methylcytosine-specific restriction endonuclease McrA
MPSLPGRSCSTPGCGNRAVAGSRCTACARDRQTVHDTRRGSKIDRGYDADHRRLRVLAFQRDNWTCVDCGWRPQVVSECDAYGLDEPPTDVILDALRQAYNRGERHLHGEHIIPIEGRPDLRLDLDNMATRCNLCHSAKTMRELRAEGK